MNMISPTLSIRHLASIRLFFFLSTHLSLCKVFVGHCLPWTGFTLLRAPTRYYHISYIRTNDIGRLPFGTFYNTAVQKISAPPSQHAHSNQYTLAREKLDEKKKTVPPHTQFKI